ncbi:MAG: UbiA family prenyltransferase [Deltaproteobacteria bacterium]|nr:UbiA family prenyltransferase [Deltaproteobacteria bacterium]
MRARTYVRLGRVSNLPTVFTDVVAAVILAGAAPTVAVLAPLVLAHAAFYVGGMFLNDAFDREIDARERPERPIPAGEIGAWEVFAVGFGLLALGCAGVAAASLATGRGLLPIASSVTLGATIVLYDIWHKGNPLSPLIMAACRVLVFVTSALVVSGSVAMPVIVGATCLGAYLVGLTWAAKQEKLPELGSLAPLVLLWAPLLFTFGAARTLAGAAVVLAFAAWTAQATAWMVHRRTGQAVAAMTAGISLLDAALVARAGQPAVGAAMWIGFGATWSLQRWARGA